MATTSEATLLTDQHRRRQVALAVTADSQMRRTWDATLDPANLEATQPIWKRAMLDTLTKWWKVSADTAAQYLPRFRQAEIGDGGIEVGIPRFDRALAGRQLEWGGMVNVLWHVAMGQTREAAYTAARELFLGMFHEAVLTGGRMTIQEWARRDSRAIGWRRVSDGNPCAFCAMLVSRGPVYTSEEHALTRQSDGQKFHPHCGCTVEVVYGDWKPSGREQQWVDDYYRAAESLPDKTPRTADTVLPIMRRSGHYRDSPSMRSNIGLNDPIVGSAIPRDTHHVFRVQLGDTSLKECLEGTNPGYADGPERRNNCQRCVVAFRMRRLGYAVQAGPCDVADGGVPLKTDWGILHWREAFKGAKEIPCTGKSEAAAIAEQWGDGGCGIVHVAWQNADVDHVFIAENIKGVVHFMDPQTGDYNVARYFSRAVEGKTTIMRIDDCEMNIPVIRKLCEEAT